MDKFNFYFGRRVTEADLDTTLSDIETAIETPISKLFGSGLFPTPTVTEKATPDLSVDIGALLGYNKLGQRVQTTSILNLGLSKDGQTTSGSAGTAGGTAITIPTAGNERWLMITIHFDQLFQDPQIDGNSVSVFFRTLDSFHLKITSGAIVTAPAATGDKPAVPTDNGILLCDIRLRSTGIVLTADVDFTRREDITTFSIINTEIIDARNSAFRSVVYASIDARLEALESDYANKNLSNTFTLTNTFSSNLIVTGDITQTNGITTLSNNSTSPAFKLTQLGTGDIINVFDGATEVFTIVDGGKVGIGTPSPIGKLHIESIPGVEFPNVALGAPSATSGTVSSSLSFLGTGIIHTGFSFVPVSGGLSSKLNISFGFSTNPGLNTIKFTFLETGKLGIGLTAPNEQLEIGQTAGGRVLISDAAGATRKGILFESPGTTHATYGLIDSFNYNGSTGLDLQLLSTGKVGIRTGSPLGTLHVVSADAGAVTASGSFDDLIVENSSNTGISILTPDTAAGGLGFFSPGSGSTNPGSGIQWVFNNTKLDLYTQTTGGFITFNTDVFSEKMRITAAGDVGIGVTIPENKLHVSGSTTLDGIVYLGNTSVATGLKILPSRGTFNTSDNDNVIYSAINGTDFPIVSSSQFVLQGRSSANVPIHFVTGVDPQIKMSISGNTGIGIGTSSPSDAFHLIGTQRIDALATPTAPTISIQGTVGTTPYSYKIVALSVTGSTLASVAGTTALGNAVLSVTNFNRVAWTTVNGAYSYNVYGRTAGSELLIINLPAVSLPFYDDIGSLTPSGALPTSNTTGRLVIGGAVNATDAFSINKRTNGSGLSLSIDSLNRSNNDEVVKLVSSSSPNDIIITAGGHFKIGTTTDTHTMNIGGTGSFVTGVLPVTSSTIVGVQTGVLASSITNSIACYVASHNAGGPGVVNGDLILMSRTSTSATASIRLFTGSTNPIERLIISVSGLTTIKGSLGIGTVGTEFNVSTSGGIISNKTGTTSAAAHILAHANQTISVTLGSGSTTGLTVDQYSSVLRFNGSASAIGDIAYYPNGGDIGEQGHFRLSRANAIVNIIPDAKLGVGSLYSAGSIGVGTTTTQGLLHLFSGESGSAVPSTLADDFIIENSSHCGMTLLSTDATNTIIAFGSPLSIAGAQHRWSPSTKILSSSTNLTGSILELRSGANVLAITCDTNSNTVISNNVKVNKTETLTKGIDVASASALTLGDGNYFDITGVIAITSIVSKGVGTIIKLHFDAITTITHNATTLILPLGLDIITEAGDELEFVEYSTGNWRMVIVEPHLRIIDTIYNTGTAVVALTIPDVLTGDLIYIIGRAAATTNITNTFHGSNGVITGTATGVFEPDPGFQDITPTIVAVNHNISGMIRVTGDGSMTLTITNDVGGGTKDFIDMRLTRYRR